MYRQITLAGLFNPSTVTSAMRAQAYADVRDAWRDYLKKFNRGRGVVLIGHSQGTFVLRRLAAREIDAKASVRRLLVSALLLGGDVTVRKGTGVGGDFRHIPACRATTQCVVAYSTFDATRPPTAASAAPLPPTARSWPSCAPIPRRCRAAAARCGHTSRPRRSQR